MHSASPIGKRPGGLGRLRALVLTQMVALAHTLWAQDRAFEAMYHRLAVLSDRSSFDTLAVLADSLRFSDGPAELSAIGAVCRASVLRRRGDPVAAYHALDSVRLAPAHQGAWMRYVMIIERARIHKSLRLFKDALADSDQGCQLAMAHGLAGELPWALMLRAEVHRNMGDHAAAMADLTEAERSGPARADGFFKCNILLNRGNLFYHQARDEEALANYTEAYDCATAHHSKELRANALFNMASATSQIPAKGPQVAIAMYRSVLRELALDPQPEFEAEIRKSLAIMHNELGSLRIARAELDTAFSVLSTLGDSAGLLSCRNILATNHWLSGDKERALTAATDALRFAERIGDLEGQVNARMKSIDYLKASGRPDEALALLDGFLVLRDSLDRIVRGETITRLEIQYETEKKDQRIKLQELELTAKESAIERHRTRQWVLGGVLIALAVIGGLLYRNQSQKRALAERERTISEQKVEEVLRTQELKLVNAMVEGQELERKRIAQDLHDRLGSMLSAIKLRFSALEGWVEKLVVEQQVQFKHLFQLLDDAVSEVRRVSHDMAKSTVTRFGLGKALEELRASIAVPDKLEVELNTYGLDDRIDPKLEVALYRMVQEMVSNVLKHARAAHLSIQVTRSVGAINLLVEDDGSGFDPASAKEGMGMGNLRSRAAEFKGVVHVDSKPGRGTSISIDIPLA